MIADSTAPGPELPSGLTVAEMAETTDVTGHTLRYYERAGLIGAVPRTAGGQRRYQHCDVEWVRFLVRLRETGMPIAQMREFVALCAQGDATLPDQLYLVAKHQAAVRRQIKQFRNHERAIAAWIDNLTRASSGTA